MRVFRHTSATGDARGAVVAAGNFDGVHLGHQAVLAEGKALAKRLQAPLAVLTFEPHPRAVFQPGLPPFRLTPFRAKSLVLDSLGVDLLFTLHFDQAFAQKSAEDFVADILVAGLGAKAVVVGYDFVFGHKRRGTADLLKAEGAKRGFDVQVVSPVAAAGGTAYSSTQIREHLVAGRPREAAALLGRPWEIDGRVDVGDKLGRTIGFPTANIALVDYLRPAPGVYAVRAGVEDGATARRNPPGITRRQSRLAADGRRQGFAARNPSLRFLGRSLRQAFAGRADRAAARGAALRRARRAESPDCGRLRPGGAGQRTTAHGLGCD